jgi:hypothetical protein
MKSPPRTLLGRETDESDNGEAMPREISRGRAGAARLAMMRWRGAIFPRRDAAFEAPGRLSSFRAARSRRPSV